MKKKIQYTTSIHSRSERLKCTCTRIREANKARESFRSLFETNVIYPINFIIILLINENTRIIIFRPPSTAQTFND